MKAVEFLQRILSDDLMSVTRALRRPAKWLGEQLPTLLTPEKADPGDQGCVIAMRKVAQKAKELSEAIEEHERELALWQEVRNATNEAKAEGKGLAS